MNNWLNKMERRYGRYGIPNLARTLVMGQLVVWVIVMFVNQNFLYLIDLNRAALLHGQIWRLVTFVFVPPLTMSPLYLALDLYFLYFIGGALENHWGTFRFNLYYLAGMLGAILSCLLVGGYSGSTMMHSLFFAFACLYPDVEFLLFFFLPIKAKWLGVMSAVLCALDLLRGSLNMKLAILLGLLNFVLFITPSLRQSYLDKKRREEWRNQFR